MADQIILFRAVDANGEPAGGAVARFYDAGTTTPLTVYTTNALSVAHGTSITADAAGNFAPAWVGSGTAVKVEVEDSTGAALNAFTRDNFPTSAEDAGTASDVGFTPTAEIPSSTVQDAIERVQTNLGVAAVSSFAQTLLDDANAAAARTTLGLGSAATLTAGTSANNLVQLNGSAQLPAVDASQLTNLPIGFTLVAAAQMDENSGSPTLSGDTGFSGVTRNGTGDYTFSFSSAEADTNYIVHVTPLNTGTGTANRYFFGVQSLTVNGFDVEVVNVNGTAIDVDLMITVWRV